MRFWRSIAAFPLFCLAFTLATPVFAEVSAREAIALYRKGNKEISIFVDGLVAGFSWYNADMSQSEQGKLYCLPTKMAITTNQVFSILEKYLESDIPDVETDFPVGVTILFAFKTTFPCQKAK